MVLYVIGLGLFDERDITVRYALVLCLYNAVGRLQSRSSICIQRVPLKCRGLEAVKRCSRVFLEAYTSVLMVPKEQLVRIGWRTPSVLGVLSCWEL